MTATSGRKYSGPWKGGQPDPPTPTGQMVADAVDAGVGALKAGQKVFNANSQVNDTIYFKPGKKPSPIPWTTDLSDSSAVIRSLYK